MLYCWRCSHYEFKRKEEVRVKGEEVRTRSRLRSRSIMVAILIGLVVVGAFGVRGAPALPNGAMGSSRPTTNTVERVTNVVERVQCWAQTKSGTRCKRRAVKGERYCRQHSADKTVKVAPEKCRSFDESGKPCENKPVQDRNYCEKHCPPRQCRLSVGVDAH